MARSHPSRRLWAGIVTLGVGVVLLAGVSSVYAPPGSAASAELTFVFLVAILIAIVGGALLASGVALRLERRPVRERALPGEPGGELSGPLVDPGLSFMYQPKQPPRP